MPNQINLDKAHRRWLLTLARHVADDLHQVIMNPSIEVIPSNHLTLEKSDTDGWFVIVARLRREQSSQIQLWVDDYSDAGGRRLCYCFQATQRERIQEIVQARTGWSGAAFTITKYAQVARSGKQYLQMTQPLSKQYFNQPIPEIYPASWNFYSVFAPEPIRTSAKPSRQLIDRVTTFSADVIRTAAALKNNRPMSDTPYVEHKRESVRRHLVHERNVKLANQAKNRDGFTCQICGINFGDLYGELGENYAEAHHIVPLASPKAKKTTQLPDLITVCANCHRMLHRLHGQAQDVNTLRAIFTGK